MHRYQPAPSGIGAMETTEEGLAVTFDRIDKHGARWLFHFKFANVASNGLTVLGADKVYQFVLTGNTKAAPPNNIGEVQLGSPSSSEIAAGYPKTATTLRAGEVIQGWLAVDTANLDFTPAQLLYRYKAVSTIGYIDPADPSTCQPETLYAALLWNL